MSQHETAHAGQAKVPAPGQPVPPSAPLHFVSLPPLEEAATKCPFESSTTAPADPPAQPDAALPAESSAPACSFPCAAAAASSFFPPCFAF
mmetsp:Transcript_13235/g.42480  ORF Transcript_13235/g.42480 Transcript_13235/m.42480 type:complete len:91 (-) Transcript_13235:962-1234(-)